MKTRVYIIKSNKRLAARIIPDAHDQALLEYFDFRRQGLHDAARFKRSYFILRCRASEKFGNTVRSRIRRLRGGMPGAPMAFWKEFNSDMKS